MIVKVITLTQPWATLVALGAKSIETRSWKTEYRGDLAIHAAKGFPGWARELCAKWPFDVYIKDPDALPLGQIVAVGKLWRVETTESAMQDLRGFETEGAAEEYRFGDFSPGRFAWHLNCVSRFETPIPAKGALSLWDFDIPEELIKAAIPAIRGSAHA